VRTLQPFNSWLSTRSSATLSLSFPTLLLRFFFPLTVDSSLPLIFGCIVRRGPSISPPVGGGARQDLFSVEPGRDLRPKFLSRGCRFFLVEGLLRTPARRPFPCVGFPFSPGRESVDFPIFRRLTSLLLFRARASSCASTSRRIPLFASSYMSSRTASGY